MTKFETYINKLPTDLIIILKNCIQDSIWHPEGSVYNHIENVFNYGDTHFPGNIEILISSIFHDLGKPETKQIVIRDGIKRVTNHGHEMHAVKFINKYIENFKEFDFDKEIVISMCKEHMRAHLYTSGTLKKRKKREDFESKPHFKEIMKFSECDDKGR
jgi:hypothetical protein